MAQRMHWTVVPLRVSATQLRNPEPFSRAVTAAFSLMRSTALLVVGPMHFVEGLSGSIRSLLLDGRTSGLHSFLHAQSTEEIATRHAIAQTRQFRDGPRMTVIGASSSLLPIPAKVGRLNRQRTAVVSLAEPCATCYWSAWTQRNSRWPTFNWPASSLTITVSASRPRARTLPHSAPSVAISTGRAEP